MAGIYMGHNPKRFQEVMGRGGVISSRPRQELQGMKPSGQSVAVPDSPSEIPKWALDQIAIEAWESIHGEVMSQEKMAELGLFATRDDCADEPIAKQK